MKKLSYWGSQNPFPARWIIFACFVALNVLAVELALWSMAQGWTSSNAILPAALSIGIAGLILYPPKRWKETRFSASAYYRYQKTMDGLLVGATFLIVFSGTQALTVNHQILAQPRAVTVAIDVKKAGEPKIFQKIANLKKKVKEKIQLHIQKKLERYENAAKGVPVRVQILLSVAALTVGVLLWYVIVALGCSVSCSGNEVLGSIIMIGGTLLVIAGLVWAGIEIWKRRGPKPVEVPVEDHP